MGKRENCRIPVSGSLATEQVSLPVRYQLYLPENWDEDVERRSKAGAPEEIRFQTNQDIALNQIRSLQNKGVERAVVLTDAANGNNRDFRERLESLELRYVVAIRVSTSVWPTGTAPLPPRARNTTGQPAQLLRRDQHHEPLSVEELALCLSLGDPRRGRWREGKRGTMHSRFACLRIPVAHCGYCRKVPRSEQWRPIEWPWEEKESTKYWLSNLPESTLLRRLVLLANQRWIISVTIGNSNRNSDWGILKGAAGATFITTLRWQSQLRGFRVRERSCLSRFAWFPAAGRLSPTPATTSRNRLYAPRRGPYTSSDTTDNPSPRYACSLPHTWPAPRLDAPAVCVASYNTAVLGTC